jgi:hypothetical protein
MKTKTIICRLTDDEKKDVLAASRSMGQTISDYVRGRITSGQKRWAETRRLNELERAYIRQSERTLTDLANEFRVAPSTIMRIRRGK